MMAASRNTVYDFMRRTEANLKLIERGAADEANGYFEVTQLINSVIGLLMFPSEELLNKLPNRRLSDLARDIEAPKVIYGAYKGEEDPHIGTVIRYLRNGFAHYNIQFVNTNNAIQGLYVWNRPRPDVKPDWIAYISIEALRALFGKFCKLFKDASKEEPEPDFASDKIAALEKELHDELAGRPIPLINPQSFS